MKDLEQPKIHNLAKLADLANLQLSPVIRADLQEITTFNLETRYADYKYEFHKKATRIFTLKWAKRCEEIYQWLLKQK